MPDIINIEAAKLRRTLAGIDGHHKHWESIVGQLQQTLTASEMDYYEMVSASLRALLAAFTIDEDMSVDEA